MTDTPSPEEQRAARNLVLLVLSAGVALAVLGGVGGITALKVVGALLVLVAAFLYGVKRMNS